MIVWAIILFAVDLALMGGIFYILISRRSKYKTVQNQPQEQANPKNSSTLIIELKNDITSVKKLAMQLEKKQMDFENYEKTLKANNRKLETVIKHAEASAKNLELLYADQRSDDNYSKAIKMLRSGTSKEEIVRNLGLLNGEVELISSINNYKI
ncbi:MAG: DUF2802 domain-containing protein [Deltaproteobacteria bacterium]|nr:DUF2802 domain-containing protein [Deltaproteobacteria bacterium]